MGLGARTAWAMVALGILLVMSLLKLAVDSGEPAGSSVTKDNILPGNSNANLTGSIPPVPANNNMMTPSNAISLRSQNGTGTTEKPSTTTVSSVSKNKTSTTKPSTTSSTTPVSSKNGTTTTMKPVTPSSTTSTTLKSTTKKISVSPTTSQTSTSSLTTTHNSSVTSVSSSVTITATINSKGSKSSKFDTGSFVGGIVLTLGVVSILYLGCRVYYARRGIQYRTIDEHDAII
ncbi:porimin [Talpa occidentalis]|uniref:porimin n=1 Tax=Talpa occidentalis TaxID=50954 RepID=UPI00188DCC98|nr:porimin [Talpa occidentalis]